MPLVIPTLPTLPTTFEVPYVLPTGGTLWTPANATDFQTALDSSALGDVIILNAGTTYTGNFKLPIKAGSAWLYIISSNLSLLPAEGYRVSPTDVANMPTIQTTTTLNRPVMSTFKSAHNYRFVGIEFLGNSTLSLFNLIQTGYGSASYSDPVSSWTAVTSSADLPTNIVLDRCYIHSTNISPLHCRCGFMMNGYYMASLGCYYKNFVDTSDAQAINIWNGGQYYKIVNNYLEASGENFMSGGTDPQVGNVVPLDIEFTGNYLYKDHASWGTHYTIKNLFELKIAERVLCMGNVMENCYRDDQGQSATGIVLTVRNQSGANTNACVRDVTISYNRIHACGAAWRLTGYDDLQTSLQNQRFLFEHNAWDDLNEAYASGAKGGQISSTTTGPATDVTFRHNLTVENGDNVELLFLTNSAGFYAVKDLLYENNIVCHSDFGLFGNGVGTGNAALTAFVQDYDLSAPAFRYNVVINNPNDRDYTFWKTQPNVYGGTGSHNSMADGFAAVGFTSISAINTYDADYALTISSVYHNWANDGTDPGPNWTDLSTYVSSALSGVPINPPEPPLPPPLPTPNPTPAITTRPTIGSSANVGYSTTGKIETLLSLIGPTQYPTGGFPVQAISFGLPSFDCASVQSSRYFSMVRLATNYTKPVSNIYIVVLNNGAELASGTDISDIVFTIWARGN